MLKVANQSTAPLLSGSLIGCVLAALWSCTGACGGSNPPETTQIGGGRAESARPGLAEFGGPSGQAEAGQSVGRVLLLSGSLAARDARNFGPGAERFAAVERAAGTLAELVDSNELLARWGTWPDAIEPTRERELVRLRGLGDAVLAAVRTGQRERIAQAYAPLDAYFRSAEPTVFDVAGARTELLELCLLGVLGVPREQTQALAQRCRSRVPLADWPERLWRNGTAAPSEPAQGTGLVVASGDRECVLYVGGQERGPSNLPVRLKAGEHAVSLVCADPCAAELPASERRPGPLWPNVRLVRVEADQQSELNADRSVDALVIEEREVAASERAPASQRSLRLTYGEPRMTALPPELRWTAGCRALGAHDAMPADALRLALEADADSALVVSMPDVNHVALTFVKPASVEASVRPQASTVVAPTPSDPSEWTRLVRAALSGQGGTLDEQGLHVVALDAWGRVPASRAERSAQ